MAEIVMEKRLGKYRLPDNAVDLSEWLRDGLDVYNLFQFMKPLFFQMLEAQGGKFTGSAKKANEDKLRYRAVFREEEVGTLGEDGYDRLLIVELTTYTPKTKKRRASKVETGVEK